MSFHGDLRIAIRRRRASALETTLAAVVLGASFGAVTTAFATADSLFFKPLPVENPSRLVEVCRSSLTTESCSYLSLAEIQDLRNLSHLFSNAAGYAVLRGSFKIDGRAEPMFGELVTGGYFETLGVRPIVGRTFSSGLHDAEPIAEAILSYDLWRRRFNADANVIGRPITANGVPLTIVGVAPPHFRGLYLQAVYAKDLWIPMGMSQAVMGVPVDPHDRRAGVGAAVARLRDGVDSAHATTALRSLRDRLVADFPEVYESRVVKVRAAGSELMRAGSLLGDGAQSRLKGVVVVGGVTILVASLGVWGVMLAAVQRREEEIAIRLALGARRTDLFRTVLLEFAVLGFLAFLVALPVSSGLAAVVRSFPPPELGTSGLSVDPVIGARSMAFAAAMIFGSVLLLGVGPAVWAASFRRLSGIGRRGSGVVQRLWVAERTAIVATVCAATIALLVVAGSFADGLREVRAADYGLERRRVATLTLTTGLGAFEAVRQQRLFTRLMSDCSLQLDGATCALADVPPLTVLPTRRVTLVPSGSGMQVDAEVRRVSPEFFSVLGIRILAGQTFTAGDEARSGAVAVVNAAAAEKLWPDREGIGTTLQVSRPADLVQVIGVVSDTVVRDPSETATPVIYRPLPTQVPMGRVTLLVRTQAPFAAEMVAPTEAWVRRMDPDVLITDARTLEQQAMLHFYPQRSAAFIMGGLGLFGLILAALSVFVLIRSHLFASTRVIAIRRALGAAPTWAAWPVCRRMVQAVLLGQCAGLIVGYWAIGFSRAAVGGPVDFSLVAAGSALATLGLTAFTGVAALLQAVRRFDPAEVLKGA